MFEQHKKADLVKRILASFIDSIVPFVLAIIPVIGALVGAAYLLTKDAIMVMITKDAQWKNRSIGKKIMNLEVVSETGADIDIKASVMRNWPLAIGTIIMIVPVIGWIIGPIVAAILGVIECVLVLTNDKGRRLGDKVGKTMVVESVVAEVKA